MQQALAKTRNERHNAKAEIRPLLLAEGLDRPRSQADAKGS